MLGFMIWLQAGNNSQTKPTDILFHVNKIIKYLNVRWWFKVAVSYSFIFFLCFNNNHNKLWRILKEMRFPDHLMCLLRNLYAVQKRHSELDMEQQIGSKLGKEYVKAEYCHPAYLTYMLLSHFSHVWLCVTPEMAAHQAPLSLGFSRQEPMEWVAISFSNAWKWKVKGKSLSCVRLSVTPWTAARQAPPSMGFSRLQLPSLMTVLLNNS